MKLQSSPPPRPRPRPYPPALYAAVHTGNAGDVAYYRRATSGAKSVLELGCGYGRVLEGLTREKSLEVFGLDVDGGLLEMAKDRAPRATVVSGDMRDFDLGRRFDRVFVPYNGAYCLLDEESLLSMLRCARTHLTEGGLLVLDAYAADAFHHDAEDEEDSGAWDAPGFVKSVEALGTTWDVHEQSRWDRGAQRIDAVYTHVPADGGRSVVAAIPQRYLLTSELPELFAKAGLALVALQGGFDQSAFDEEESSLFVAIATPVDATA
ncbi:MAG: class I SAM-dependent methyltransferase [Sandaracinus sp.]|nr:class I SAM-dependent methyltransferase [Sandaracinus sp.]